MPDPERPPPTLPTDPHIVATLCHAALAVTEGLDLRDTLARIVDAARRITGARYGACGVLNDGDGFAHFIHAGMTPDQVARIPHEPQGHGLLGLILRQTHPVRTPNIAAHPNAYGFPATHPPMTTFLGLPLLYRGANVGNLYLTDKADGEPFTAADETAVTFLAGFAAIAIANANQYLQVNDELERRRAELDAANHTLHALSSRVLWMLESERRLIAQELHDSIGQALAGAILAADAIAAQRTAPADPGAAPADPTAAASRLSDLLRDTVKDVRRISHGLRPTLLDELGPVAAIRDVVDQLRGDRTGWITFQTEGVPTRLPEPIETVCFRIAQEALTNAVRHSGAAHIDVRLVFTPTHVTLHVSDNGIGFPPPDPHAPRSEGLGLAGMRERAALVNGRLTIDSAPGRGVHLTCTLPTD